MVGPVAAFLVLALLIGGLSELWEWVPKGSGRRKEKPDPAYDATRLDGLSRVVCGGAAKERSRSVRLWFADIKAKVCKPYVIREE